MTAIEHITTVSTAPWVMWWMLFLLVLFVIANIHQPKMVRAAVQIAFKRTDRVYDDAAIVGVSSLELRLFSLLTVALSWTLFFYTGGAFLFGRYMLVTACVLVWCLVRWGIRESIAFLGGLKKFGFPKSFTMSLSLVLSLGLWGINLVAVWTSDWVVWRWLMAAAVPLWVVMNMIKHYQCFVRNWKTFFGWLVYGLTVEVGLLIGLYFLIRVI